VATYWYAFLSIMAQKPGRPDNSENLVSSQYALIIFDRSLCYVIDLAIKRTEIGVAYSLTCIINDELGGQVGICY
jgi:hypothetical protein